jgi:hypothetical protein
MGFADGFRCSLPLFQEYIGTIVDYCVLHGTTHDVADAVYVATPCGPSCPCCFVDRGHTMVTAVCVTPASI